jgi:hypothetical protein
MAAPKLTEAVIRAGANEKSFQRGRELYRSGAISNASIQGQSLSGECEGNESPFYKVRVELDGGGIRTAMCTCPYDFGGYCKHIVALPRIGSAAPKPLTRSWGERASGKNICSNSKSNTSGDPRCKLSWRGCKLGGGNCPILS